MKPPATQAAREVRAKLQALAARGIAGEAETAQRKLARLEARYDWSAPCEQAKGDIFAGCKFAQRSTTARLLASFPAAEIDIAPYVQWAVSQAANINGALRSPSFGVELWVEADASTIKRLQSIAEVIRRAFRELWASFSAQPGVPPSWRKVFLLGLYDSMMSDDRRPGQMLPPIVAPAVRKTKGKRKLALAPAVTIHPYTLALELGRSIRLSVPLESIAATLEERCAASIARPEPRALAA